MKKSIISCAAAMLVIAGLVTGCGKKEVSPVAYAPADADLIAYVNVQKISANKIATTLRAREDAKEGIAEAEKKSGLKVDDLLKSEGAIFVNTKTIEGNPVPAISAVVRFAADSGDMSKKLFDFAKKENKTVKETKVDGKAALADDNAAIIALSKSTIQISAKQGEKAFACLAAKGETELTKAVDTTALISIAYKAGDEARKAVKEQFGGEVPNDITFVTANLRENKDNLDVELVFKFEKAESAKAAQEYLAKMRDVFKGTSDDPKIKKSLEDIRIEAKGKALTISSSEKIDEIIETINQLAPAPAAKPAK